MLLKTSSNHSDSSLTRSSLVLCHGTSMPGCDRMVLKWLQYFHTWKGSKTTTLIGPLDIKSRTDCVCSDLLLFLPFDVLILGIPSLISECGAVLYKVLNDFLLVTNTHTGFNLASHNLDFSTHSLNFIKKKFPSCVDYQHITLNRGKGDEDNSGTMRAFHTDTGLQSHYVTSWPYSVSAHSQALNLA